MTSVRPYFRLLSYAVLGACLVGSSFAQGRNQEQHSVGAPLPPGAYSEKVAVRVIRVTSEFIYPPAFFSDERHLPTGYSKVYDWEGDDHVIDVRELLKAMGFERPLKAALFFADQQRMVLAGEVEAVNRAAEVIEVSASNWRPLAIEMTLNLWAYATDQKAPMPKDFAELQKVAGDSLRLLDSQTVMTKSGVRVEGRRVDGDVPYKPEPDKSDQEKEAPEPYGSTVSLEAVIGPDRRSVDFALDYRFGAAASKPGGRALKMKVSTNLTIEDGAGKIIHSALIEGNFDKLPAAKVMRYALHAGPRVVTDTGESPAELIRKSKAADVQLAQKVRAYVAKKPKETAVPKSGETDGGRN